MFDQIKSDLTNFPDEVITDWIEPFAQSDGWPPTAPRWRNILLYTIEDWQNHTWNKVSLDLTTSQYAPSTHRQVNGLRDAYLLNRPGIFMEMMGKQGEQRYLRALTYLLSNGVFPKPIILRRGPTGLELMDGNHRFLAWSVAKQLEKDLAAVDENRLQAFKQKIRKKWGVGDIVPISTIQDVWVATPS